MKTHQEIAKELDLFSTNENCLAGVPLYHPNGARIVDLLKDFIKGLHIENGYQLVQTPHIYKSALWKISGHYDKYKENMFFLDDTDHAIKPMNCPAHILIYKSRMRSYKELPLRLFEFGNVYRNELEGTLNGLFRCRSFTQDDAHVFLRLEDVESEVTRILGLVDRIFGTFNLAPKFYLSSSPRNSLDDETCAKALVHLENALKTAGRPYEFKEGEGAFYGPKIDACVIDSIGREWQLSTIQLDLNLPRRFGLRFQDRDTKMREPVIIHRAILGSIDRFFGILLEDTQGWLPPVITPISFALIKVGLEGCDTAGIEAKAMELMRQKGLERYESHSVSPDKLGRAVNDFRRRRVRFAVIIGKSEMKNNEVVVKDIKENVQTVHQLGNAP